MTELALREDFDKMDITYRVVDDILYIGMAGSLDISNAEEAKEKIFDIREKHSGKHVVLDAVTVTFNEAATMLNRVLALGDVDLDEWYADRDAAPSWAAQAVGNMEAVSVLSAGSFGSLTMEEAVKRADAAQMLCAAKTLLEGDEPRSLKEWWQEQL